MLVEGPLNNLKQSMVAFARPQRSWQSLATPVFTPAQMATAATGGSQVKKGRGRVRIQTNPPAHHNAPRRAGESLPVLPTGDLGYRGN